MSSGRFSLRALAALLLGLMFFDKPFAYLGIGPLFITELVLLLGLLTVVIGRRDELRAIWRRLPRFQAGVFALFVVYEAIRTASDVPHYRLLALRDGVVWGYALFAVIIASVAGKGTLERWAAGYRRIVPLFVAWVPIALLLYAWRPGGLTVPGHSLSLYLFKPGDLLVHLAGVGAALALWPGKTSIKGFRQIGGWLIALLWGAGFVMAASLSRGGLLACIAGMAFVACAGSRRQLVKLAAGTFVVWAVFALSGLRIVVPAIAQGSLNKEISARQLGEQVKTSADQIARLVPRGSTQTTNPHQSAARKSSVAHQQAMNRKPQRSSSSSGRSRHAPALASRSQVAKPKAAAIKVPRNKRSIKQLRLGTIRWRLQWWRTIIRYTFEGPYLLTGKGFGINLADSDGFQPEKNHSLRDPHNVFMTFLARSGAPGLLLFLILIGTVLLNLLLVWRRGGRNERKLALWLFVYLVAMLVNGSFDVYIANPMGGVWFWSVIGAAMVLSSHGGDQQGQEAGRA